MTDFPCVSKKGAKRLALCDKCRGFDPRFEQILIWPTNIIFLWYRRANELSDRRWQAITAAHGHPQHYLLLKKISFCFYHKMLGKYSRVVMRVLNIFTQNSITNKSLYHFSLPHWPFHRFNVDELSKATGISNKTVSVDFIIKFSIHYCRSTSAKYWTLI